MSEQKEQKMYMSEERLCVGFADARAENKEEALKKMPIDCRIELMMDLRRLFAERGVPSLWKRFRNKMLLILATIILLSNAVTVSILYFLYIR